MKTNLKQISETRQIAARVRETPELYDLMEDMLVDMLEGGSMRPWEGRLRDMLDSETVAYYQRPDRSEIETMDDEGGEEHA